MLESLARSKPPASLVGPQHLIEMIAAAALTPMGCFVEVGVYQGGSAFWLSQVAEASCRELYLFDTFSGIPYQDEGDSHQVGEFSDVDLVAVRAALPYAEIIPGIFPASAYGLLPPVAFAHLDCDQHRSVKSASEFLVPLMVPGGVIWFDDSPVIPAARRAAVEVFGADRLRMSSLSGRNFVVF